jgi:nucleoside 2-deoxyribosyltransferase
MSRKPLLLVGEICVDFTLGTNSTSVKMRLGGIVHAARALWASGIEYAVAAICPEYLHDEAAAFLHAHQCVDFIRLGSVHGAPNVMIIGDVRETSHQGYEDVLRDRKSVHLYEVGKRLTPFQQVVIYPGAYELSPVIELLSNDVELTIDIAYDVQSKAALEGLPRPIRNLVTSTSSDLFTEIAVNDVLPLLELARDLAVTNLLLKENRGGSRLYRIADMKVEEIPAVLGDTVNSVGVGDAFTAVYAALSSVRAEDAAWRGMQVATRYSQTTYPDDLYRDVHRDFAMSIDQVRQLGGVQLPWHERKGFEIYLAAPDFSYVDKPEIDAAVSSLNYHNFNVRRPIFENGEAPKNAAHAQLSQIYFEDVALLERCAAVFAVPLYRDPGTLVEIGMAIAMGKPVITFDPRNENNNTMVMCGSRHYSRDLDQCLGGLFTELSRLRRDRR